MLSDREVIEENTVLLRARWELLRDPGVQRDCGRLGMPLPLITEVRELDEIQVKRAADCATPLFQLSQPEDTIRNALVAQSDDWSPFDQVDKLIEHENYMVLVNRWVCAKASPVHAQAMYGMSETLIGILLDASLSDLRRASRQGFSMVSIAAKPKYFFHAGRNLGLKPSQRTALGICSTARAFY